MELNRVAVLIPALNPDQTLIQLVAQLRTAFNGSIVIINDGSKPSSLPLFDTLKSHYHCHIIHHPLNRGKGAALKTGLSWIETSAKDITGVVLADADGQHHPEDILKMVKAILQYPEGLILGTRQFHLAHVPWKSRWGNTITSWFFYQITGQICPDTQTGLRAFSRSLIPLALATPGDRFEYEMNQLMMMVQHHKPLHFVPIQTIYENENVGSHFKAWRDATRIYRHLLPAILTRLIGYSLQLILFVRFMNQWIETNWLSIMMSSLFALSFGWLFKLITRQQTLKSIFTRFLVLRTFLFLLSVTMLYGASYFAIPLWLCKIGIDTLVGAIFYRLIKRDSSRK